MELWWIVGPVVLLVAALAYVHWYRRINNGFAIAGKWVWGIVKDPKTCKVAETFFTESAVLWFVFPLLDEVYDSRNAAQHSLHDAYILAIVFALAAVILSHIGGRGKEG